LEKEYNCYTYTERQKLREDIAKKTGDQVFAKMEESRIGLPRAGKDKWASCIRIVDPFML
jgi:hypothetical protein